MNVNIDNNDVKLVILNRKLVDMKLYVNIPDYNE